MPVFCPDECLWRVSGVPRRVSTVSLQGVGALMEYLRAAFETLNLIGLLTFLSRFCSDTGPLLLDNSVINYYLKNPCLDRIQHSLLNSLKPHAVFVSLLFRKSVFSFPPDSVFCLSSLSTPLVVFQSIHTVSASLRP